MSVGIIDTTVFCNLLDVPGRNQDRAQAQRELADYVTDGVRLLLPLAVVYETGNHIAHAGGDRHAVATRFANEVRRAITGENPFAPARVHDLNDVERWLDDFPDRASAGVGLADLSILHIWEQQRTLNRLRRVFIWSYDEQLQGYDFTP